MKRYKAHGFLLSQGIISVLIIVLMAPVVIIGGHTYINAGKCSTAAADTSSLGGYRAVSYGSRFLSCQA